MKPRKALAALLLLILATPLFGEDVFTTRTRKVTFNVGQGGNQILDSVFVSYPAFVLVELRTASQNACSTFAVLGSQNDSGWVTLINNTEAVSIDSISNSINNSAAGRLGWYTLSPGTIGDGSPGYIPKRFLRFDLMRTNRGAADSATTTNLDTVYITTRVARRFR